MKDRTLWNDGKRDAFFFRNVHRSSVIVIDRLIKITEAKLDRFKSNKKLNCPT